MQMHLIAVMSISLHANASDSCDVIVLELSLSSFHSSNSHYRMFQVFLKVIGVQNRPN